MRGASRRLTAAVRQQQCVNANASTKVPMRVAVKNLFVIFAEFVPVRRSRATASATLAVALAVLLTACDEPATEATAPAPELAGGEPLATEVREGPVSATVSLTPAEPRLGDLLVLSLTVAAEAGVSVEMPAFGDALGRFAIVDFTPRQETTETGGTLASQRYTLQAPMSGRQRIPRLRIEYVDTRPGQSGRSRELLTDELGFEVASVLPEGAIAAALRPPRGALEELQGSWLQRYWPWLAVGLAVLAAAAGGIRYWLRHVAERARLTAYDRALARLDRLQRQGLPDSSHLDAWYVELSDIVRRYIEARFGLRAPELTTEEFLLEAGRAAALSKAHRELLSAFLERCDRVKFARYSPAADESQDALQLARRFLDETSDSTASDTPPALTAATA